MKEKFMDRKPLIRVNNVCKDFKKRGGNRLLVLDHVNFTVREGEVVALLGKSGSGKSTLLRTIAGLMQPSAGEVLYRDQVVKEPMAGVTMVFQQFALLPWLTVLENVELGLEALGVEPIERRKRALKAIDVVGLDGFESAYPKELSGGMCQRVGLARALVVEPEVLLMDEPFSALDVLTADTLRTDLVDILQSSESKIKSVILVTHNIEEAVALADRIMVFSTNPGFVRHEVSVNLEHPRDDESPEFRSLIDKIYTLMTDTARLADGKHKAIGMGYRLPKAEVSTITGLMTALSHDDYKHKADLPELAEQLQMDVNELFPITECLEILRFAEISQGDIVLSEAGRSYVDADMQEKKAIFSEHVLNYVPFAKHIRQVLDGRDDHAVSEEHFLRQLEDYLSEQAAEEVLKVIIDWGRYAEIFAYDYNTGLLSLENPE